MGPLVLRREGYVELWRESQGGLKGEVEGEVEGELEEGGREGWYL